MSAGKGDAYRPVNQRKYGENYDAIFRKDQRDQAPEQAAQICTCPDPLRGSRHGPFCAFAGQARDKADDAGRREAAD